SLPLRQKIEDGRVIVFAEMNAAEFQQKYAGAEAGDGAADVRPGGDPRHSADGRNEVPEEPADDEEVALYLHGSEPEKPIETTDFVFRIDGQIHPEQTGNGTTRSHRGVAVDQQVKHRGHDPAAEIGEHEIESIHHAIQRVSKNPEENHVAD